MTPGPEHLQHPPAPTPPGRPPRPRWLVPLIGGAAGLAVLCCVGAIVVAVVTLGDQETLLEAAKAQCAESEADVRVGDGGISMTISRVAAESRQGASMTQLQCIFDEIEVPDAVISQMETTRALDGRQDASWDGFTASWTYHPDDGLNLIIQETR